MLQELIHNARRRLLLNEVLKQFALSAALAIAGLAMLLTLGTRYLEWWVVALFAIAVTVWAVAKLRKRLPSDYAAAVWLDDKTGSHDSISTAHYFTVSKAPLTPKAEAMLLAQRNQAEAVAGDINVSIAVPFRFPKALYGLIALLLVSSGLVTVRYFYGHDLNLSAPITEVIFQDLAAAKRPNAAKPGRNPKKPDEYDEARSLLAKLGLGADLEEKPDEKLDEALAEALKSTDKTPGSQAGAQSDQKSEQGDPMENPQDAPNNNGAPAGDNKNPGNPGQSPGSQSGANSGDKADKSLLSKLKDAMDSMMGAPSPSSDNKKSGSGKQQQSKSGSQPQAGQQQQSSESGDQEDKQAAEGEANGQSQSSKSPGQTSGNSSEKQEGPSAAGSEDGEKAIKAAAQIKAMGKISELIGKRSEEVTGESMIEVQSGNQKLQTAYQDKAATHGEGTGEVGRDAIPVSEQAYVQEYFQQVRKPAGSAAVAPGKAKKPAANDTPPATTKPH
jgi:hypothetical protein